MESKKELMALAARVSESYFKRKSAGILGNVEKKNVEDLDTSREKILFEMREDLKDYTDEDGKPLSCEVKDFIIDFIRKDLWGYGAIDELVQRKDISDIKLYDPKRIRIKVYGKRMDSGVTFPDTWSYQKFITKILERNKVNLGTANAIQTFTDSSQDGFILRNTVMSGLLCDEGLPMLEIRKIPKDKYTLMDLLKAGMFYGKKEETKKEVKKTKTFFPKEYKDLNELMAKMVRSKGILFTGKGASGKTTLMNAMIAEIPHDESVMICQENRELFDNSHPDLFSAHVMTNAGDSKVSYELGDLTRAALLVDLDRVIVGEVKEGSEAVGLSKASMTGHKCWTSVHGESCEMAVDKMADYISQATGYSTRDSLKQLQGFEYVVHLKDFSVDEIIRIAGWDKEKEELVFEKVYPFEREERHE